MSNPIESLLAKAEAAVRSSFPHQTAERMIALDDTDARITLGDLRAALANDLLAEAEARGVERGRREALTEAADAAEVRWPGLITFRNWLRARAGETPGGAA